jgi:diguanylate cyclase (GGDEF)-like protein
MWEALREEGQWAGEIWNRRKEGTVYPEWLTITAMRDATGQTTHYVGNFSDLSDAKAAESRIQWLSHFDVLTGLPNRTLLQDRTESAINRVQRANEPLAMMMVGIDHFKSVNDTLGYRIGDELLLEMAKRLSSSVRDQDTVARLGGKEFVLVLPDTPAAGAAHLASDLLWKLAQPYQLSGHELTLTASIGIASFPENGADFNALFKSVEIAMHRAQASGRDSFQFYSEAMYQQVLARDLMTKALRHAIERDQFQLVYQPLVDLQTGKISGMEALLRWHHPELGSVSPVEFIPLAEESGLIKGIGEWVLRQACRDIRQWLDQGMAVPHVAVNVSPLQFHDSELIDQISRALTEFKVAPERLYIEVTESALMDDVPRSEAMLNELKDLGLKLSLDDFGTGYSSLAMLKRLPLHQLKIDQAFVHDMLADPQDASLVRAIITMGESLSLDVIAEGVETRAQRDALLAMGCRQFQGYLFGRPGPRPGESIASHDV